MTGKRKIYFRADAGPEIGYGHYIRSLALADMLKQDFDCTMFTQVPTDYQLRECEAVCPIMALPDDDSKFDKFLDYLRGNEIVVLDNYFYTTDYQRAIKAKGCKLICIDDMHDRHYVADVVINYGCEDASLFDVEPYTRLCLGLDFLLLRRPFRNPINCDRAQDSYVICFGGADWNNLTYKYVKFIKQSQPKSQVLAIIGDSYQYEETLKTLPNVEILKRLSAVEMANLFSSVENVICSASTTCYEALSCGAHVYAGWYADNQIEAYNNMVKKGYISPLNNLLRTKIVFPNNPQSSINRIIPDYKENIKKVLFDIR